MQPDLSSLPAGQRRWTPNPRKGRSRPRSWRRSASEDAHTREHRSSSPARQGAYSGIDYIADNQSFSERHLSTRCGEIIFCRTYPCLVAEKLLRRELTQSSSMTNESSPASCDADTRPMKLAMRDALGAPWSKELFSLLWPTRASSQGRRVAAGKSSRIGLSQKRALPNNICGSPKLRTSACKRGKTRSYGSVALATSGICLRVSMSTRPRFCSVVKSYVA